MKKKVLLFAALFMMVVTASFTPSKASQAKSISRKVPDGRYITVKHYTKIRIYGNKIHIKGYMFGDEYTKDYGKINKTLKLRKNAAFSEGTEVNDYITNHKISRRRAIRLLKDKKHPYVTIKVKKGKVYAVKLLTE